MRCLMIVLSSVLLAASAAALHAHERELILAGGALRICSSLSPRECTDAAQVTGAAYREPSRHAFDPAGVAAALDPRLWPQQAALRASLAQVLTDARARHGDAALTAREAGAALATRCVDASKVRACAAGDEGLSATLARTPATRVWHQPGAAYAGISALQLEIATIANCDRRDPGASAAQ